MTPKWTDTDMELFLIKYARHYDPDTASSCLKRFKDERYGKAVKDQPVETGTQIRCDMDLESASNGRTGLGLAVQELRYRGIDKNSGAEITLTIVEKYFDTPQIPSDFDITFNGIIKRKMENTKSLKDQPVEVEMIKNPNYRAECDVLAEMKSHFKSHDARKQAINHAYHLIKDMLKDEASAENLRKQFPEFESSDRKSLNVSISHDEYQFNIDAAWLETALNEYVNAIKLKKLNFKVSEISKPIPIISWDSHEVVGLVPNNDLVEKLETAIHETQNPAACYTGTGKGKITQIFKFTMDEGAQMSAGQVLKALTSPDHFSQINRNLSIENLFRAELQTDLLWEFYDFYRHDHSHSTMQELITKFIFEKRKTETPWTVQDLKDLGFREGGDLMYYPLDKPNGLYDLVYRNCAINIRSGKCNYVPLKFTNKQQIKNFIDFFKP